MVEILNLLIAVIQLVTAIILWQIAKRKRRNR